MAYNEALAQRIRDVLHGQSGVEEKAMFGGLAFMVNGHMCVGVIGDDLMVRVGKDGYASALSLTHARPMDFTGKPLKTMVYVGPPGTKTAATLRRWIERGCAFVETLPPKSAGKAKSVAQEKRAVRRRG